MTDPMDPNPAPPYAPPPPFAPPPDLGAYAPPPYPPHPDAGAYGPPPGGEYPLYAYPWAEPPPPRSHRRPTALIAAAVVVILTAAGVGGYLAFRGSGSSGRVALPDSFQGFSRENDAASRDIEDTMRFMEKGIVDGETMGVYQSDADVTSKLLVLALPNARVHDVGNSPGDLTAGLLRFMASAVPERPPGLHGGSSRCGTSSMGTVGATACAWSDPATTGMLVSAGKPPLTPDQLSAVEQALRNQID